MQQPARRSSRLCVTVAVWRCPAAGRFSARAIRSPWPDRPTHSRPPAILSRRIPLRGLRFSNCSATFAESSLSATVPARRASRKRLADSLREAIGPPLLPTAEQLDPPLLPTGVLLSDIGRAHWQNSGDPRHK